MTVGPEDTAKAVGSGDVDVFATPCLVALCERAAILAVENMLGPGMTTVGIAVDVKHLAPTPVGQTVDVEARLDAVDGRRLTFSVRAIEGGHEVARGRHVRMIVDRAKFLARAGVA